LLAPGSRTARRATRGRSAGRRGECVSLPLARGGYPIGSGPVESANKLVVEARLKRAGIRWARPRVNPKGGSDGLSYRIRYTSPLPAGHVPPVVRHTRGDGPAVLLEDSTIRAKVARLGVSHEAVRQRMRAHRLETDRAGRHAARDVRIRESAAQGVPWQEIARAVGLSIAGVRFVCRDLPPRKAGRRWTKSPHGSLASRDYD
jgi:hypothetical protein